jgi:hypothetical protein
MEEETHLFQEEFEKADVIMLFENPPDTPGEHKEPTRNKTKVIVEQTLQKIMVSVRKYKQYLYRSFGHKHPF